MSATERTREKPKFAVFAVSVLREPLTHFLAIGLAIFVADKALSPVQINPSLITADDAVYGELSEIFADVNERAPTVPEMSDLVDRWVMNEVLYREARSLGLQEGDEMIRERIMQKMRILIQNGVTVDAPDEVELQAWFEANREAYDLPSKISFEIARIDGDAEEARGAAEALNAEAGDYQIFPFSKRPRPSLVQTFGEPMIAEVESLTPGTWQAIDTVNGWQAVRLSAIELPVAAVYEEIKNRLRVDYEQEAGRLASTRALEAMIAKYEVAVAPYDPADFQPEDERAEITQ